MLEYFRFQSFIKNQQRFQPRIFKSVTVHDKYMNDGYVVLPLLDQNELLSLRELMRQFLKLFNTGDLPTEFYPSGRDQDLFRRGFLVDRLASTNLAKTILQTHFEPNSSYCKIGEILLRPPHAGALMPHQDNSIVDETKSHMMYCWIPIQDVDENNGTINVIPGSHLIGNFARTLDIKWEFCGFEQLLQEYSISIPMKAGEILFFDSALIHGSGVNIGSENRFSMRGIVKPAQTPFIHYFSCNETPKGSVEAFNIDLDFFVKHDYRKRPDTDLYPYIGLKKLKHMHLNEKKVRRLLKKMSEFKKWQKVS